MNSFSSKRNDDESVKHKQVDCEDSSEFKCACGKVYDFHRSLTSHIERNTISYTCPHCSKVVSTATGLKYHLDRNVCRKEINVDDNDNDDDNDHDNFLGNKKNTNKSSKPVNSEEDVDHSSNSALLTSSGREIIPPTVFTVDRFGPWKDNKGASLIDSYYEDDYQYESSRDENENRSTVTKLHQNHANVNNDDDDDMTLELPLNDSSQSYQPVLPVSQSEG